MPDGLTAQEFATVNNDVEVTAELNDREIVMDVKRTLIQNDSDSKGGGHSYSKCQETTCRQ